MSKNNLKEYRDGIEKKYKNKTVTMSNAMIRGRENTNLLQSKIEMLAIAHTDSDMKQMDKTDSHGNPYLVNYVVLTSGEIKELMGRNDGETYSEIRNVAVALGSKVIIIEDKKEKKFGVKHPYEDVVYEDGKLYVQFNPDMEKLYFRDLKNDFTMLQLEILFNYKRNGGFQLYRLIRSYIYPPNLEEIDMNLSQEDLPEYSLRWDLNDLKMQMGLVDINQSSLARESSKKNPDWEKMVAEEKSPKYKRWDDFNKRVIQPGVAEINEISDIYIKEVVTERSGKGGKVSFVTFVVQRNRDYYLKHPEKVKNKEVNVKIPGPDEIDDFVDDMRKIIAEDIKTRDLKVIAETAAYDIAKVKKAYECSRQAGKIDNLVAWLISAIKNDYDMPIEKKNDRKNAFKNFEEREYDDLGDIERELNEKALKKATIA